MKILIAYHTMTGNTEMVAKSIAEGLEGHDIVLKPASEVDPSNWSEYDMVFLGSGVYAGTVGKSIKKLVKAATSLPKKFVLFSTHAISDSSIHIQAFRKVKKIIEKAESEVCAEFDCLGETKNISEELRLTQLEKLTPEKRKESERQWKRLKGHPNTKDLEKAKNFVKSLI
ncbi:MAG: flavodoxin family protein [Promethearchaeota archaeon]